MLKVENICKSFGGNLAVNNASLEVQKGSLTSLIGSNGAGKTTLFNCIAGYYPPDSGDVYFKGKKISKVPAQKLCRMGIARTFQIAKPFGDLSVRENVAIGGYNHAKSREEAFALADQTLEFAGLGQKRDEPAYLLNTCEQRKLELARALATKPSLLLLDEVMAGLTPSESAEMIELIRQIRGDKVTILMIEHIMPVVMKLSDVIYVLDRGRMICSGTPSEVAADKRVIESYLGKRLEDSYAEDK